MIKKKILIIEDDKNLLINIKSFLEEEDFNVKTAIDGESGIATAKKWMPDLIICDINIPLKDGYEVLKDLSKNKLTRMIPFIFLTAKVEKEDLRKGMQLGADDYIFKPFNLDDLLNSIKVRLEKAYYRHKDETGKKENINKLYEMDDKILINTGRKIKLNPIKDLIWIKSASPYVHLKFYNGKSSLKRETLNEWESKLPIKYFIRIHRSMIINTEFITKIEKMNNTSYIIRMKEESEPFVISKRYSAKLKDRFS